jgi:hypothetical protein
VLYCTFRFRIWANKGNLQTMHFQARNRRERMRTYGFWAHLFRVTAFRLTCFVLLFYHRVKCTIGSETCYGVSSRSLNSQNAHIGPLKFANCVIRVPNLLKQPIKSSSKVHHRFRNLLWCVIPVPKLAKCTYRPSETC